MEIDILPIPLGRFGAYYATINMRKNREFRRELKKLQEMGVFKIRGHNDVMTFWIKAENRDELEKRKDEVKKFIEENIEKIYKMYKI